MQQQQQQVIIYDPPYWCAKNTSQLLKYYFEVLKNGSQAGTVPIDAKTHYTLGRNVDVCDIAVEHPSVSRIHAIIQFHTSGRMFIYDMGSTHGTFWNKKRIKPFIHVPVRLGDQIKFGESTRTYVLSSDDERATRLEETRQQQQQQQFIKNEIEDMKKKHLKSSQKQQQSKKRKSRDEDDDNLDDDAKGSDDDQDEAALFEGEDARGRLRIEDEALNEDAMFDEEDEYFDRTRAKTKKDDNVETIDSLMKKRANIDAQLNVLQKNLASLQSKETANKGNEQAPAADATAEKPAGEAAEEEEDALDSYMKALSSDHNTKESANISQKIAELQKEHTRLSKLIEIARPAMDGLKSREQEQQDLGIDLIRKEMFVETAPNKKQKTKHHELPPQVAAQLAMDLQQQQQKALQQATADEQAKQIESQQQQQAKQPITMQAPKLKKQQQSKPSAGLYKPQTNNSGRRFNVQQEEEEEEEDDNAAVSNVDPEQQIVERPLQANTVSVQRRVGSQHSHSSSADDEDESPQVVELTESQIAMFQKMEAKKQQ